MIDALDTQTHSLPLDEPKRRRGRPATGKAMTPAERQKAYRERLKSQRNVTESESTHDTKSLQLLRERALSRGKTCVAQARKIVELEARIADLEAQLGMRTESKWWVVEGCEKGKRKWYVVGGDKADPMTKKTAEAVKESLENETSLADRYRYRIVKAAK